MQAVIKVIARKINSAQAMILKESESFPLFDMDFLYECYGSYDDNQLNKLKLYYESHHKFQDDFPNTISTSFLNVIIPFFFMVMTGLISLTSAVIGQSRNLVETPEKANDFVQNTINSLGVVIGDNAGTISFAIAIYFCVVFFLKKRNKSIYRRYLVICDILETRKAASNPAN